MSELLSWPVTPTNSMTDSDFLRIWSDYSVCDFLDDDEWCNWVIPDTEEDDNTDESTLEDFLDTYPKLILRLEGHQKQPHYTGHSMMYIEHRHYGHKSEPNAIVRVHDRPSVQSGQHTLQNVTDIDSQLTFGSFGEAELGKRNRWKTIPEHLLQNAKLLSWKWHRFDHQMEGIFEVPATHTIVTRNDDAKASSGKPVSWFRWGGRYYNPAYLYTMKHDKEFCFQVWSTQDSHENCKSAFSTEKRICSMSSKEATKMVETWHTPCRVTHILCRGESPTILRFPGDYIPSKNNPKHLTKRARRKKTRGKSLSIVINPNNLGYLTTFRIFYFHAQARKWINLGIFPGNADAKTWVTIDLSGYHIVTNRLRVEPVDFHGSGAFKIEVWGETSIKQDLEKSKDALEPVLYELTWPTTPEMRRKIWKAKRHWNMASSQKDFYSRRRGKKAQYAFQRECQDFVLT